MLHGLERKKKKKKPLCSWKRQNSATTEKSYFLLESMVFIRVSKGLDLRHLVGKLAEWSGRRRPGLGIRYFEFSHFRVILSWVSPWTTWNFSLLIGRWEWHGLPIPWSQPWSGELSETWGIFQNPLLPSFARSSLASELLPSKLSLELLTWWPRPWSCAGCLEGCSLKLSWPSTPWPLVSSFCSVWLVSGLCLSDSVKLELYTQLLLGEPLLTLLLGKF